MTVGDLQAYFLKPSSETRLAPEDFFVLLAHITGKDKTFLLAHPEYDLDTKTEARARECFARRSQHEPVSYIIGHKEFYGRDFIVTKDTLIPRPETEHIIELILDRIKSDMIRPASPARRAVVGDHVTLLVDVGTGSGNIIITLAQEIQKVHPVARTTYHATDISEGALAVAQENAKRHGVTDVITFHEGSLLEPIDKKSFEADEVIIAANLPYLSHEIYQAASDDVKHFEPHSALVSTQDGLDHYFRLLEQTRGIRTSVTLFLEISPEQTPLIRIHLEKNFPKAQVSIHQDLSGRDRVVEIHL